MKQRGRDLPCEICGEKHRYSYPDGQDWDGHSWSPIACANTVDALRNTRRSLSDQIAYRRSLCDAATPGGWYDKEELLDALSAGFPYNHSPDVDAAFIAAHSPDVVSALLDVAEALQQAKACLGAIVFGVHGDKPFSVDDAKRMATMGSDEAAAALATLSQRMEERP